MMHLLTLAAATDKSYAVAQWPGWVSISLEVVSVFAVIMGIAFMFMGAVGVYRMPDVYHRLHASSKCATLGVACLVIAAILHVGTFTMFAKGVLALVFAFTALPVGSHMLAKAALMAKSGQWSETLSDEHAEDVIEETELKKAA